MPEIDIPADLLSRLQTIAEKDYGGVSIADALDRMLREHQEYVMIEAAGELRENAERTTKRTEVIGRSNGGPRVAAMSRWSREIKLANLDLNLLVALDALLQERSVTRAAAVMGVSQPALSSSLAKLRRHFGDDLLTRVGNSYQLSPLGIQLSEQTSGVLAGVVRVFSSQPDFDPQRSDREFVVECSDYVAVVLGPVLMEMLAEQAPRVRLNLHHVSVESIDAAAEALRTTTDAFVFPHGFLPDNLPYRNLFEGQLDLRGVRRQLQGRRRDDHGSPARAADGDDLPAAHRVRHGGPAAAHDGRAPARADGRGGLRRRCRSWCPAATGSRWSRSGWRAGSRPAAGVRLLPCPFDPLPLVEAVRWHPLYDRDVGHRWLRDLLAEAAAEMDQA